jgi:hypothetical protein
VGGWRSVPPIQRAVATPALVSPPDRLQPALLSWRNPSFLAPLGHVVDPQGPSGYVPDAAIAGEPAGRPAADSATSDSAASDSAASDSAASMPVAAPASAGPTPARGAFSLQRLIQLASGQAARAAGTATPAEPGASPVPGGPAVQRLEGSGVPGVGDSAVQGIEHSFVAGGGSSTGLGVGNAAAGAEDLAGQRWESQAGQHVLASPRSAGAGGRSADGPAVQRLAGPMGEAPHGPPPQSADAPGRHDAGHPHGTSPTTVPGTGLPVARPLGAPVAQRFARPDGGPAAAPGDLISPATAGNAGALGSGAGAGRPSGVASGAAGATVVSRLAAGDGSAATVTAEADGSATAAKVEGNATALTVASQPRGDVTVARQAESAVALTLAGQPLAVPVAPAPGALVSAPPVDLPVRQVAPVPAARAMAAQRAGTDATPAIQRLATVDSGEWAEATVVDTLGTPAGTGQGSEEFPGTRADHVAPAGDALPGPGGSSGPLGSAPPAAVQRLAEPVPPRKLGLGDPLPSTAGAGSPDGLTPAAPVAQRTPLHDHEEFRGPGHPESFTIMGSGLPLLGERPATPVLPRALSDPGGATGGGSFAGTPAPSAAGRGSAAPAVPLQRLTGPQPASPASSLPSLASLMSAQAAAAAPALVPRPATVQRTADPAPVTPAPEPVVQTVTVQRVETPAAPAPATAPAAHEPDELVAKLFDPLLRRLRAELRIERDRRGALTDLRH